MNKEKVVKAIVRQGFLPLYFHPDERTSIDVLKVLYESGIRVVEYTNRGKQALKNFRTSGKGKLYPISGFDSGTGNRNGFKDRRKSDSKWR